MADATRLIITFRGGYAFGAGAAFGLRASSLSRESHQHGGGCGGGGVKRAFAALDNERATGDHRNLDGVDEACGSRT